MSEPKKIPDDIKNTIAQVSSMHRQLSLAHSNLRTNFLEAESNLLRKFQELRSELKTLVAEAAKACDIPEADQKYWSISMETGELTRDPKAPPPPSPVELIKQKYEK